jgi:hypothetical protein
MPRRPAILAVVAVALLGGCAAWAAQLPPPPPPFVSDEAKAEAVGLLGAATAMEQDGQLGLALDLARQAQAKDPTNPEAGAFLKTVAPQATAAAKAAAQATAPARDADTQAAPAPVAEPAPLTGASLGALRGAWVSRLGEPTKTSYSFYRFSNGTEVLWQAPGGQERAWHIEVTFPQPVPLAAARTAAGAVRPADAQLVRTYTKDGDIVDVYHSAALAQVFVGPNPFGGAWFGEEPPGTFIEIFEVGASPRLSRVVVGVGNRP